MTSSEFQHVVYAYYHSHTRDLPWRHTDDPYCIAVSEIMLQQTQAERVISKYEKFIQELPNWDSLAQVDTQTLLGLWQGLGYNRRALNLKRLAQVVSEVYNGVLPLDPVLLKTLPGIGAYTAGAICAFAGNMPVVMIETNIRRAVIHHFFQAGELVHDLNIFPILEEVLDPTHPREWYYALMDYGAMLGKTTENANRRSRSYTKQSAFNGSLRQLRGELVRLMTAEPVQNRDVLLQKTGQDPERFQAALTGLIRDGFLLLDGDVVRLTR